MRFLVLFLYALIGLLAILVLASCKTTGDPGAGGLYGWSEDKAKQRHANQKQEHQENLDEIAALEVKNKALENKQKDLDSTIQRINRTLNKLSEEQANLRQQLNQLYQDKKLSEIKYQELKEKYSWLKSRGDLQQNNVFEFNDEVKAAKMLKKMASENNSVVDEILLLIGQ